jgi:hypothetical protein
MPKYIVRTYAFIECEVEAEDEHEASSVFDNNTLILLPLAIVK